MENPEVLPPDFQARAVFVRAPPTPSLLAEMASSWSGWRTKKRGEPFDSPLGFVDILHPHLDAVELGDSLHVKLTGLRYGEAHNNRLLFSTSLGFSGLCISTLRRLSGGSLLALTLLCASGLCISTLRRLSGGSLLALTLL